MIMQCQEGTVVDVLMKNQNPFDLATVPPELTDMITGCIASPEVTV